jgi:two-component system copper resistance phosphate regulon response regulator CusR
MKILIVEDEPKTGDYLRQGLREAGFAVDLATTGPDGLHLALHTAPDLVILDVMLPGMDGWQVLQRIRSGGQAMPVLFLTARDQVEDRVKGLELGADDYLVKPFSFAELLAGCASSCGAAMQATRAPRCEWPTWNWICCAAGYPATASVSI